MTIDLSTAVVYDVETFPNAFTLDAEELFTDRRATFVISPWRDDRQVLMQWFNYLAQNNVHMIGFNNLYYDMLMIDYLFKNPFATNAELKMMNDRVINQQRGAFPMQIWQSERFAPQIDLSKIHHFDNNAKRTSLKALQVNMRSKTVLESSVPFDREITLQELNEIVIPYNVHDVQETKKFALHSMDAIKFRVDMIGKISGDILNFSDTKIGGKILEEALGEELCYERVSRFPGDNRGKKIARQTVRNRIALNDVVFPYIQFEHPEFQRVLNWMRQQVLSPADISDTESSAETKGIFKGVHASVGGIEFKFGTGGIHASVLSSRFVADSHWLIRDIDVTSLYPNIAIQNQLAPAHLGERFVYEYSQLPIKRKEYQALFGKKSVPANSMKLASNGTYGNSANDHSVFLDKQFTMTITINGQLMLCMLAERLLKVPSLQLIQVNTDGITYRIHDSMEPLANAVCREWEKLTKLVLEDVSYSRMWIRDVNSYIAETIDGKLKIKGAYWTPDEGENYAKSISESQPPAWHKDLSACVVQRAAVAHMTKGVDIETFIRNHADPFDFMCRVKVDKSCELMLGTQSIQRTSRYYVAVNGLPLRKIAPARGPIGAYCRKPKISDAEYNAIAATVPAGVHDPRIHTKNKSTYKLTETAIEAGWLIAECNDASSFRFDNVNYAYYIAEARKLII